MSRTLNLVDRLLALGRNYQHVGRNHDALQILKRLAGFQELPADIAEETHARLAELNLHGDKYLRARRHLSTALVYQPENALYHYLMATAHTEDEKGDKQRAAEHFRKSLALDPKQPRRLAEYGELLMELGEQKNALAALREAVEQAPQDPEILHKLVTALSESDEVAEARKALRVALFHNARDARFRSLWNDFQFRQLHAEQRAERDRYRTTEGDELQPRLLPFVRPEATPSGTRGRRIRHDPPTPLPAPHRPRRAEFPRKKRAQ